MTFFPQLNNPKLLPTTLEIFGKGKFTTEDLKQFDLEALGVNDKSEGTALELFKAVGAAKQQQTLAQEFDDPFREFSEQEKAEFSQQPNLKSHAQAAIEQGFHIFPLRPKAKITLPGSHGFKDAKDPSSDSVLEPWNQDPSRNIGIAAGESDLCVLDFDVPEDVPAWLNETRTYKVKTSRGIHIYFRGARRGTKMYVNGKHVGEIKSIGGYVLAAGSVHPDGPVYTVVDDSETAPTPERVSELLQDRDEKKETPRNQNGLVPHGAIHPWMVSVAGGLRAKGLTPGEIEPILLRMVHENCEAPIDEAKVTQVARSMGNYNPGMVGSGVILGTAEPRSDPANWRSQFRNLSEMEQGDVVMIIDGVLQEGIAFIGANPAHGKTLVALAFAKAICLGEPLFGIPEYKVKQPRNVVYLIPESGDKPFRKRGEAFRLPQDDRFIARTISSGGPLALSDPALIEAVRQMKPVVILDTASRFLQANDENSAAQNRLLVNDVIALRAAGAVCVIILHHAKKSLTAKREPMTLDNMLRGTSDFGAMCDQAYGIRMDEHLYNRGAGPMEIDLVNLKDRERLGGVTSIRLAATYKNLGDIFPKSYIDETGNFRPVEYKESKARDEANLNSLVEANPTMTITELSEATGLKPYTVKETLKKFGWHMAKGGPTGHSPWHKESVYGQCPYKTGKKGAAGDVEDDHVTNLDAPASVN
jgi:hypothetical protein